MRLAGLLHPRFFRQRPSTAHQGTLIHATALAKVGMPEGDQCHRTIRGFLSKIPRGNDLMRDQLVPPDRFFAATTGATCRANDGSIDAPKVVINLADINECRLKLLQD